MGCGTTSPSDQSIPASGGSAGQAGSAGSSTGGNAGTSATGGNAGTGGAADAGLGGSAGSSGIGGDASYEAGSAGQAGSDAGDDAAEDAAADVSYDSAPAVICPSCDELLTWDATKTGHSTYGKISTGSGWDDSYAWQMLNACTGWSIVDGHEGGIGDTLEIGACNDGVVLIWAYDIFMSVQLSQGWTGKTDTNMAIGTSFQEFVQTHPGYTGNAPDASGYTMLTYANGIVVFKQSVLFELTVN